MQACNSSREVANYKLQLLGLWWPVPQPLVAQAWVLPALGWQLSQPWCAWLAAECWALALELLAVWMPGCARSPVLADYAAGSVLGGAAGIPPALLGASSPQCLVGCSCPCPSNLPLMRAACL
ncbi:hypothetical protein HaLaN_19224 [Haematococcus lacustris]|uniref:Uncharacterized protein n=1 Tax=Haematococcus lacustris TaxID=44745 RepID=A0A699ZQ96_HAELA|nr:hypothetical protein HaLaN_19224 [Haematococcus lacustris]